MRVTAQAARRGEELHRFWAAWFGYHSGREVLEAAPTRAGWTRAWLGDPGLFMEHITRCEELGWPCYMSVSVYSRRGRLHSLDRLFWDFDSKEEPPDLEAAWRDARRLHDALESLYKVGSLIVASGMKGYHVYVFLLTPVTFRPEDERLVKAATRLLQARLLQGLELPTMDRAVLGDIARLARVPYTMHQPKLLRDGGVLPGGLCQPLTPERRPLLLEAADLGDLRARGVTMEMLGDALRSAGMGEEIRRLRREAGVPHVPPRMRDVRSCLEKLLRRGSIPHQMRLAIVTEHHHRAGLGEDELVALFRGLKDFDEGRTRYQVRHILRGGYKPWRCATIGDAGFCLEEGCPLRRKGRSSGRRRSSPR